MSNMAKFEYPEEQQFNLNFLTERTENFEETQEKTDEIEKNGGIMRFNNGRLPSFATFSDLREIAKFLYQRSAKLSLVEFLNSEPRRIFEARKLAAYENWGILIRSNNHLELTTLGIELAETGIQESYIFEKILISTPAYMEIIRWVAEENLTGITHNDVISKWENSMSEFPKFETNSYSEAEAVSFFSICHAAHLGVVTIGKRGQPARLLINLQKINSFLAKPNKNRSENTISPANSFNTSKINPEFQKSKNNSRSIYISNNCCSSLAVNLCKFIELNDFTWITGQALSSFNLPRLELVEQMRSCSAGIIILNETDLQNDINGNWKLNDQSFMEIMIALAIFSRNLIIIWDSLNPLDEAVYSQNLNLVIKKESDIEIIFQTIKLLRNLKI